MAAEGSPVSSILSGNPISTLDKLIGSENYQIWADSVELWFIEKGHVDHLTYTESNIVEDKRPKWRQIDALLCNLMW